MSTTDDSLTPDPIDPGSLPKTRKKQPEYETEIEPVDPFADFVGENDDPEQQSVAKTAGEQDHENPWAYADLDGPHSPPSEVTE